MDATQRIERGGVDIRVALTSQAKTLSTRLDGKGGKRATSIAAGLERATPGSPQKAAPWYKLAVKRALRPPARVLFKIAKPILRPLAFRLRSYLSVALQAQAQQLREDIARDVEAQKQLQLQAIERLLTAHTIQVVQELQAMRANSQRPQYNAPTDTQAAPHGIAIACGPGEVMLGTAVGYIVCRASDYTLFSSRLEDGEVEPGIRLLIQKLLAPGATFVDVNAMIGMYTLTAAAAMQGKGRIVAFEADPAMHELLRKSISMNGFSNLVETVQAAVSDRACADRLRHDSSSRPNSLHPSKSTLQAPPPLDVPLVRIDDVLGAVDKVDLIKFDGDCAQPDAVRGAKATIERNPELALIVEFGGSRLSKTGCGAQQWLREFEPFGFTVCVIDPSDGTLHDKLSEALDSGISANLFLARPGTRIWNRARGIK
jgi:FkbM family methyltransferase